MVELIKVNLKIIIVLIIITVCLLIGGYIYLNKMETLSANLNINKTNTIDKMCNYSIFSDFYYRIIDYKNYGNSFAQLTPVKLNICYNFKTNKIELVTNANIVDSIILDNDYNTNIDEISQLLNGFQEDYTKIVATQDPAYFDTSYKLAKKMYYFLYKKSMPLKKLDLNGEFYTQISNLPIDNLVVKYFKLNEIKNPPKQAYNNSKWQPNILEWDFGEDDRIYLQYLTKFKQNDLDDYIRDKYATKDKTIVRLTKFNNNQLSKMFLIFDNKRYDKRHEIKALFMDNNGYVYDLILNVQNKKAFRTYFNDFMKIAYGIYFVKKDGFVNKWAQEDKKERKILNNLFATGDKIIKNWKILHDELKCSKILNNYNETKFVIDFISWKDNFKKAKYSVLDKKFDIFKNKYGYPTDKIYKKFHNANENLKLIIEGIIEETPLFSLFNYEKGCKTLQKKCSNSLECIKNLKNNNEK